MSSTAPPCSSLPPAPGGAPLYPTFRWEGPDPAEAGIAYEPRVGPPDAWHYTFTGIEAREFSPDFALETDRGCHGQVAIRLEPNRVVESERGAFHTREQTLWYWKSPYPQRAQVAKLADGEIVPVGLIHPNSVLHRLSPQGELLDSLVLPRSLETEGMLVPWNQGLLYVEPGRSQRPPSLLHFIPG